MNIKKCKEIQEKELDILADKIDEICEYDEDWVRKWPMISMAFKEYLKVVDEVFKIYNQESND